MFEVPKHSEWEAYEQRKQALQLQGLSSHEYEQAVRQIVYELGV